MAAVKDVNFACGRILQRASHSLAVNVTLIIFNERHHEIGKLAISSQQIRKHILYARMSKTTH
jgi:hypothetical protein